MSAISSCNSVFQIAGYCTLLYAGIRVFKFLTQACKESLWSKTFDFKKYGNWAVITGGSDGIGKALAFELAQYGLNIVLIARTREKLERVRDELEEKFNVEVVILCIDFTDDDSIYDVIKDNIKNLNISLLVNNVAVANIDPPLRLLEIQGYKKYSEDAVKANIRTLLKMTEMILPSMVERKGGVIANISSVIGARESPFLAIYGATKSFMLEYSKAMADEYQSKGVVFQCILPGIVATPPIAKTMPGNFIVPTPEKYAKYLIKALGKSVCTNTSFFWHIVFQQTFGRMPDFLFAKLMGMNSRQASNGVITLLYLGSKALRLFLHFWRESLWSSTFDFKKFGNWVVITGGSDGIGKSTAIELAKCNMNIVVIARTLSKLEKVAKEITEKYHVEVIIIHVDVTDDDSIFDVIREKIEDLDIAVLINNVAIAQVDPTKFLDVPNYEKYSTNCIKANINTMIRLTEIVLPGMVKRGGGLVVNVSSLLGSVDSPFYAMYGGSKKMIITYTAAMAKEYQSRGVIFQAFSPGATETQMTSGTVDGSSIFVPKGEDYGKFVIKALGKSSFTNTSCLAHNVFQQILYVMPTWIFSAVMEKGAQQTARK